jgi:hypothetical protein
MAVTPAKVSAAIMAAGPSLQGPTFKQLCVGVGLGVTNWSVVPANLKVRGVVTGGLGAGTVKGKLVIPPNVAPVVASVAGVTLVGPSAAQVATAVGLGVANAYSATGQYIGVATAVGVDISKVVFANPGALIAALTSGLASQGMVGPTASQLCNGLGAGLATMFLTGAGVGTSVGPSGFPGAGTSVSWVI